MGVKNWMTVLCVVLAVCFATGVALAADKATAKSEGPVAKGKVVSVDKDGKNIVVTVDGADVTFAVNADTKVKQGKEEKTLGDVKAGGAVVVSYKEADGAKTALVIRIQAEGGKHHEAK